MLDKIKQWPTDTRTLAKALGVTQVTITRCASRAGLEPRRIGSSMLFNKTEAKAILNECHFKVGNPNFGKPSKR